jgi:hypothetical protein
MGQSRSTTESAESLTKRIMRHLVGLDVLTILAVLFAACSPASSPSTAAIPSVTSTATSNPTQALGPTPTFSLGNVTPTGPSCGLERWPVKTLADPDSGRVDFTPRPTEIQTLRQLRPPSSLPEESRISPVELETYVIQAQVQEFKLEADSDVHVVVSSIGKPGETMIVELVDVGCTKAGKSNQREAMLAARQAFVAVCGLPSSRFKSCDAQVEITGVGFFDLIHGQTGVAPNGIELHPVIGIRKLN